jgi:hypothetical protein
VDASLQETDIWIGGMKDFLGKTEARMESDLSRLEAEFSLTRNN